MFNFKYKNSIFLELLFSLLITILFIVITVNKINWEEFISITKSFDSLYIIPAIVFLILMHLVHSARWYIYLSSKLSGYSIKYFLITNVTFMTNSLIPFRIGDFVKIYLARKYIQSDFPKITSSVIVGHYFDFTFLFLLMNIMFALINLDTAEIFSNNWIYYSLFIANILITVVIIFMEIIVRNLRHYLKNIYFLKNVLNFLIELNLEIKMLTRNINLLSINVVLTILYWICLGLLFKCVSLGLGIDLDYSMIILAVVVSAFAISIPLTPASIGTFHLAIVYSLSIWISDQTLLFTYALILHSIIIISIVSLGSVSFLYLQLIKKPE